jgi:hypothetical protein
MPLPVEGLRKDIRVGEEKEEIHVLADIFRGAESLFMAIQLCKEKMNFDLYFKFDNKFNLHFYSSQFFDCSLIFLLFMILILKNKLHLMINQFVHLNN